MARLSAEVSRSTAQNLKAMQDLQRVTEDVAKVALQTTTAIGQQSDAITSLSQQASRQSAVVERASSAAKEAMGAAHRFQAAAATLPVSSDDLHALLQGLTASADKARAVTSLAERARAFDEAASLQAQALDGLSAAFAESPPEERSQGSA